MPNTIYKPTSAYWASLYEKNPPITAQQMMGVLWDMMAGVDADTNTLSAENRPDDIIIDNFGANAYYFTAPDEFDEYMCSMYEHELYTHQEEMLRNFINHCFSK